MESKVKWRIESGKEFEPLYPKATLVDKTEKRGATVYDTVAFIPKVVGMTMWQTEEVAPLLVGKTEYETCKNVWYHVKKHFAYHKDEEGREQIRSPRRSFHDRFKGIDCDCATVLCSSLLLNCGIDPRRLVFRITKYRDPITGLKKNIFNTSIRLC